jgi:hypothetical protein
MSVRRVFQAHNVVEVALKRDDTSVIAMRERDEEEKCGIRIWETLLTSKS